jgi:hypothetical protein
MWTDMKVDMLKSSDILRICGKILRGLQLTTEARDVEEQ